MSSRTRKQDTPEPEQEGLLTEAEVEIRLISTSCRAEGEVLYDNRRRQYLEVDGDGLLHLLTLPSRILHQASSAAHEGSQDPEDPDPHNAATNQQQQQQEDVAQLLQELYGNVMSAEQLAKLDSQPNPFNFSDRVSQTFSIPRKEVGQQTEQPPSCSFGRTMSPSVAYDSYGRDYCLLLARQRQKLLQEDQQEDQQEHAAAEGPPSGRPPEATAFTASLERKRRRSKDDLEGRKEEDSTSLPSPIPAKTMERIVNQNIHDGIIHDFRYWEDVSDDFRPLEGSLLPLWKLSGSRTASLLVADVCWSPVHSDLLAAAYAPGKERSDAGGLLCLYSLKNPGIPERYLPTPCGLTSVQFHPKRGSLLVAGRSDGAVMVVDIRRADSPQLLASNTSTGLHLAPVSQVRWVNTELGENLSCYSVGEDGRVLEWTVRSSSLEVRDLIHLQATSSKPTAKPPLDGTATCVAVKLDDRNTVLVGVDTGTVYQMRLTSSAYDHVRYPAHSAPVKAIVWNNHHHRIFATTSLDWMLKIWILHQTCPLVTLDLGASVAGLTWCHHSSTVIVGVTEEGRVHVYDLYVRKCRPICLQNLLQRRRSSLACLALNPVHPVLLVGGDRGFLLTFKLSPNLRRPHKEAKGADEQKLKEIELAKMERVITTAIV